MENNQQMETDVKRLSEVAARLRAQIGTEIDAVTEEGQKLSASGVGGASSSQGNAAST